MSSSGPYARDPDGRAPIEKQLENYRRLRELVDEWISLAAEVSDLRIHEQREAAERQKTEPKLAISKEKSKRTR